MISSHGRLGISKEKFIFLKRKLFLNMLVSFLRLETAKTSRLFVNEYIKKKPKRLENSQILRKT